MSQEEAQNVDTPEIVGAQVAPDVKLTPATLDLQVQALPKAELEALVKRYFATLNAIAEVECELCGDEEIACEHNQARQALEYDF